MTEWRGHTMLYSIPELSKMFNIPTTTIHYWIKTGKITADDEIRDNKLIKVVDEDELRTYASTKGYKDKVEASLDIDESTLPIEHFQAMSLTIVNTMDRFQNLYDRLIDVEREAASLRAENDMLKLQLGMVTKDLHTKELEVVNLRAKLENIQQGLIKLGPIKLFKGSSKPV